VIRKSWKQSTMSDDLGQTLEPILPEGQMEDLDSSSYLQYG
jgi:hypothetical protein